MIWITLQLGFCSAVVPFQCWFTTLNSRYTRLFEFRHCGLSHRDRFARLRGIAHGRGPSTGLGRPEHAGHQRTAGGAICEAAESQGLGNLIDSLRVSDLDARR